MTTSFSRSLPLRDAPGPAWGRRPPGPEPPRLPSPVRTDDAPRPREAARDALRLDAARAACVRCGLLITSLPLAALKFEEALGRLEEIVQTLERGDLSLDESLKAFEEGVKLSKNCLKLLDDAEKRVEILIGDHGHKRARPFDLGEAAGEPAAADPGDGGKVVARDLPRRSEGAGRQGAPGRPARPRRPPGPAPPGDPLQRVRGRQAHPADPRARGVRRRGRRRGPRH